MTGGLWLAGRDQIKGGQGQKQANHLGSYSRGQARGAGSVDEGKSSEKLLNSEDILAGGLFWWIG